VYVHPPSYDSHHDYSRAWQEPWERAPLKRLTHLVLVDGRLVDTWSEPVEGTEWERYADQFDVERRPVQIEPAAPATPPYDEMLGWLDCVLGGRAAVQALTADTSPTVTPPLPLTDLDLRSRHRLESVADLLDMAGQECFGPEATTILRRALLIALDSEPELILQGKSATHTAAGLCWIVGKANGLFGPTGLITQGRVAEVLGFASQLSGPGPSLQRAFDGFHPRPPSRPVSAPDLLPLGDVSLLTASTRRLLVRLRDRAVAAKRADDPTPTPLRE
jgi:hypothetical protein